MWFTSFRSLTWVVFHLVCNMWHPYRILHQNFWKFSLNIFTSQVRCRVITLQIR
jgi:hypothetical protein